MSSALKPQLTQAELDALQDADDVAKVERALAAIASGREVTKPLDDVLRELGLTG